MRLLKKIVTFFLLCFTAQLLFAQAELPKLPDNPAVSRGVLPSGIRYILVENQAVKGLADVAILQRTCQTAVDVPTRLLAGLGIGPGKDGYVRRVDEGLEYEFRDCPVILGSACTDSLLNVAFRIMKETSESADSTTCGTTNQTFIMVGDIDRKAMLTKIMMLSESLSLHQGREVSPEYEWHMVDGGVVSVTSGGDKARVEFCYHMPASSVEDNDSVVSVMADQFQSVLGTILESSASRGLHRVGIAYEDLCFEGVRSNAHVGDDIYKLSVVVGPEDAERAVDVLSGVLGAVVGGKVSLGQYEWAYRKMVSDQWAEAQVPMTNAQLVEKCRRAVLYNASLATRKSQVEFYRSRVQDEQERLGFFNMFTASLAKDGYLELSVEGAPEDLGEVRLRSVMEDPSEGAILMDVNYSDTLGFPALQKRKIKEPVAKKDVLTGGNSWTYSNGLNIIHKKMTTGGLIYFSWLLRGGEEEAPSFMDKGIGPYTGEYFRSLLAANGIDIGFSHSSKGVSIVGRAESSRLQLLFKSLQLVFASMPELGSPAGGPLLLISDRSDYSVQKSISQLVGGFDMTPAARPRRAIPVSVGLDMDDEEICFQALYSCDCLLTGENFMMASIAENLFEKELTIALDGTGYHAWVEGTFVTDPKDRYAVHVKVGRTEGVSQDVSLARVRTIVRNVISSMGTKPCPKAQLDAQKKLLLGSIAQDQKTPEYWAEALRVRFLESRDMVTGYADKVNQTSSEKICELFRNLQIGGMTEYTNEK